MKIYRKPKTADDTGWIRTDDSPASKLRQWKPGVLFPFSATWDKNALRSTDIGMELSEEDIIALHDAMISNNKEVVTELQRQRKLHLDFLADFEEFVASIRLVLHKLKLNGYEDGFQSDTERLNYLIEKILQMKNKCSSACELIGVERNFIGRIVRDK